MDMMKRINNADKGKTHLFFLGQAGFLLKSSQGSTLAVDPYLSNCCERLYGYKRLMPQMIDPCSFAVDYVAVSHKHEDHFDVDALPDILAHNEKTKLIAAPDAYAKAIEMGLPIERILEIQAGDLIACEDIVVEGVSCDHGFQAPEALGFVIKVDGLRIYFTGDTCLRLDIAEEVASSGKVDVLLCPINGRFGNMSADDALMLCQYLKPSLVIPCHYWNFAEHGGDPDRFIQLIKANLPSTKVCAMRMGECLRLESE